MKPERLEEANNTIFKNPYTYDERLKPRLISGQDNQGISPSRLNQLLKKGHLTGRTIRIIQFLYECQFLTGHLIQCCFYHPRVMQDQKKLRNDAKNPYLSEIKFLIRIGAVSQYGYFDRDNRLMSSYIYSLTSGCRKWANERFFADQIFSRPPISKSFSYFSRRGEGEPLELMWLQNLLSFNQFHTAMAIQHWNVLTDIEISHIESPYGFYIINDELGLCAASIRNCTYIPTALFKNIPDAFLSKKHIRKKVFIIITETIVTAAEIMHHFRRLQWPYLDLLLFTTDSSTKDGKNPLKDELVRFKSIYNDDYEICSLRI